MLEFSKTRVGKKFIEHDIPALVQALSKLSESISESNRIEEKKLVIEQKRYLTEKNAGIISDDKSED